MIKIYVAASFSYTNPEKTDKRKTTIENIVKRIQQFLIGDYFLPHQIKLEKPCFNPISCLWKQIYEKDLEMLQKADLVLFLSFGQENNAGSAWEIGYASAKNIPILMIKMTDNAESLMIINSVSAIITPNQIEEIDWNNWIIYKTPIFDVH